MTKEKRDSNPRKYKISLVEQESQRELWQRNFTTTLLWLSGIAVVVIGAALVWCLIAFTPLRTTIPGYPNARSRHIAVQNALKIDSLENLITRWDLYAENLRRISVGEQPLDIDSVLRVQATADSLPADASVLARRDSLLRQKVTANDRIGQGGQPHALPIEGMHFISPLKGVVTGEYDPLSHPYVDISAPAGSLVMTVLDGTVILAGWSEKSGYTIAVQHAGGLLTLYKHNQKLLKEVGDKVTAGTSIALVGNTGSASNPDIGEHLHFELWHDGESVNPMQYINF
jgi:murein DD-endopeptidase MepM/ murein hydrolase activator NlpD